MKLDSTSQEVESFFRFFCNQEFICKSLEDFNSAYILILNFINGWLL